MQQQFLVLVTAPQFLCRCNDSFTPHDFCVYDIVKMTVCNCFFICKVSCLVKYDEQRDFILLKRLVNAFTRYIVKK